MVHEVTERPPGPRARARQRRLEEILAAGLELVRTEGIEALTTHRLAAELGLAVGALYRYFPSKAALVAALEGRCLALLGERLEAVLLATAEVYPPEDAALARLLVLERAYGAFARERPAEFALLGQVLADPRTLVPGAEGAALMASTLKLLTRVAGLFAECERAGLLGPGDALERAVLYWAALRGALGLAKLRAHSSAVDAERLSMEMARVLLLGMGAPPARLARAASVVRGAAAAGAGGTAR
ncbi:MAG: TetR/AcrR family transcriptional regulator [Deltaproteobacteria bacterium]|nr:TetR/AcrR family transcriptional regulator [Deltaproteobacteria bacterium]